MKRKLKIPTRLIPWKGFPMDAQIKVIGALVAKFGKKTEYGTIQLEVTRKEIDAVGGIVFYDVPGKIEVTPKGAIPANAIKL